MAASGSSWMVATMMMQRRFGTAWLRWCTSRYRSDRLRSLHHFRPCDLVVSRAVEAPGCACTAEVFRMFQRWQMGHELWRDPMVALAPRATARRSDRGRAQRALAEWLQFVVDYPDLHLPAACSLCGSLTRHLCAGCLVHFCTTCTEERIDPFCCEEARASGDMRLEMPAIRFGESTGRIIQQLVRENLPLVQQRP